MFRSWQPFFKMLLVFVGCQWCQCVSCDWVRASQIGFLLGQPIVCGKIEINSTTEVELSSPRSVLPRPAEMVPFRPMLSSWMVDTISNPMSWLVVTGTWLLFFHILGIVIPIDVHILQRGGSTTNQFWSPRGREWVEKLGTDLLLSCSEHTRLDN